jgi:uncharacterized membrane protein
MFLILLVLLLLLPMLTQFLWSQQQQPTSISLQLSGTSNQQYPHNPLPCIT